MTRRVTVLFATLEAVAIVAAGIAVPLVVLSLVWAVHLGFDPEWAVIWRAAIDVWLLGHGVDVTLTLDAETAAALGVAGAEAPVPLTIALLGFAMVSALLGARLGRRIAEGGHPRIGAPVALVAVAGASLGATLFAVHPLARPSIWQGVLLPTVVIGVGLVVGLLPGNDDARRLVERIPADWRAGLAAALRAGLGAAAATLAASAVLVTALLVVGFAEEIRLYEALHTEVVGGIALTVGQAALLPNLVVWAGSWLVGPGFALGTGSLVSPLGTSVGPVPALPVLGALPTGDAPFAFAGLLVPVVAGFLAGVAVRPALDRVFGGLPPVVGALVAVGSGAIGGLALGLLAAASAGAAGPGRLAEVGPDALAVGLAAAAVFAVSTGLGLAVSARLRPVRREDARGRPGALR